MTAVNLVVVSVRASSNLRALGTIPDQIVYGGIGARASRRSPPLKTLGFSSSFCPCPRRFATEAGSRKADHETDALWTQDRGLGILAVDSEQEARKFGEGDPSVRAGLNRFEIHPMRVSAARAKGV